MSSQETEINCPYCKKCITILTCENDGESCKDHTIYVGKNYSDVVQQRRPDTSIF